MTNLCAQTSDWPSDGVKGMIKNGSGQRVMVVMKFLANFEGYRLG